MSTISSSTTSTTAYKVTADTTGTLVIQTGATPTTAVTVDTSQNVGIGTSSPTTRLDVYTTTASTTTGVLKLYGANGADRYTGIDFHGVTSETYNKIAQITALVTNGGSGSGTPIGGDLIFRTNNSSSNIPTEKMRIDSSGNVGIGQTSQVWDEKLGVRLATSGSGTVGLGVYSASTTYASSMIRVQAETGGSGWKMYEGRANGGSQLFWVDGSGGAYFAGNVGIGTSSPGYKFEVTGGDVRTNTSAFLYANTLRLRGSDTYQIYESAASTNLQVGTASGAIIFAPSLTERMRLDTSGNLQFNSGYGSVATAYGCRAWVNFNGTGTVAIRASGNVTSITDNGVGDYTVNFTNAMPDANYGIAITAGGANSGAGTKFWGNVSNLTDSTPPTTTTMRFLVGYSDTINADCSRIQVAIFR